MAIVSSAVPRPLDGDNGGDDDDDGAEGDGGGSDVEDV